MLLERFLGNQLLVLLAVIFVGYAIGHIKIRGVSLGNSACLFVAMAAGALGAELSPVIASIGIIFFVYAIGLQAGPQFFHLFGKRGLKFAVLSVFTVSVAAGVAILLAIPFHLSTSVAVGAFAGAMTSTPALASAINTIETYIPHTSAIASISYAIAYPFGLISEILFVQIMPKIYRKRIAQEREEEAKKREEQDLTFRNYRLTNNNLAGKTLEELDLHRICHVNLTRFKRGDKIDACLPETRFEPGDIVVAVGLPAELDKFRMLFGDEVDIQLPRQAGFEIRDIFLSSSKIAGKPLRELRVSETYGVTISRIYRGDVAITPTGGVVLEIGDLIRAAGPQDNVDRFVTVAGSEKRRLDDTNILILMMGMFLGAILGEIPLKIGALTFQLGAAGGPLFVALVISHFGKIGKWSVRVPAATKFFLRDIGLVFFLTGVGVKAGSALPSMFGQENLWYIFTLGIAISLITMFAAYFLAHNVFGISIIQSLGAVCGAKTSSPSLAVLVRTLDDESPAISYAGAYPVAIICLTIIGQFMVLIGMSILT